MRVRGGPICDSPRSSRCGLSSQAPPPPRAPGRGTWEPAAASLTAVTPGLFPGGALAQGGGGMGEGQRGAHLRQHLQAPRAPLQEVDHRPLVVNCDKCKHACSTFQGKHVTDVKGQQGHLRPPPTRGTPKPRWESHRPHVSCWRTGARGPGAEPHLLITHGSQLFVPGAPAAGPPPGRPRGLGAGLSGLRVPRTSGASASASLSAWRRGEQRGPLKG